MSGASGGQGAGNLSRSRHTPDTMLSSMDPTRTDTMMPVGLPLLPRLAEGCGRGVVHATIFEQEPLPT